MAFQYDANGQRVKKTVNGAATTYWRDTDGKIVRMQKGSDVLLFLYEGDGRRVGFLLNGVGYYYVYNAQGDVVGLIDKNGTQVVSYVYDAWGRAVSVTGSSAATAGALNPFRYRGYEYDTESGLYYLLSRYYDPMTMRFVNADEYAGINEDMATNNLFVYCGNNPVNRVDDSGLFWESVGKMFATVAVAAAVVVAVSALTVCTGGIGTAILAAGGSAAMAASATAAVTAVGTAATYVAASATAGVIMSAAADNILLAERSENPIAKRKHYSSKKEAREAAKRAGKGREPKHHPNDPHGPHYHPDVPMPKPGQQTPKSPSPHDHYFYPKAYVPPVIYSTPNWYEQRVFGGSLLR